MRIKSTARMWTTAESKEAEAMSGVLANETVGMTDRDCTNSPGDPGGDRELIG